MTRLEAIHPVLAARDVALSAAFYQRLGFRLLFMAPADQVGYAVLARDAVELHLQWADGGQWIAGLDRPVYRFLVEDVDLLFAHWQSTAAFVHVAESEASPYAAPRNTPWGTREFHVRDPGGNGLHFYRGV